MSNLMNNAIQLLELLNNFKYYTYNTNIIIYTFFFFLILGLLQQLLNNLDKV